MFNEVPINISRVWAVFYSMCRDLIQSKIMHDATSQKILTHGGVLKWKPPNTGWTKINVDAMFPLHRSTVAIGAIAYDENVVWLGLGSKGIGGKKLCY